MAAKSEKILRDLQVVPATVAVIDGHLQVGLSHEEIELLGTENDVEKTSFNTHGNSPSWKITWRNDCCYNHVRST